MKKFTAVLLLVLAMLSSFSQEMYEWTEPVAVTDSVSFNANPYVWVSNENVSLMFYEKKLETAYNSMIYKTELNGNPTEIQVLANDQHSYYLPAFMGAPLNDRMGFLFYLADITGKYEVYASEYLEDGSIGQTFKLTNAPANIEHFTVPVDFENLGWVSNGDIYIAKFNFQSDTAFLSDIMQMDSTSCEDMVSGHRTFAWEKQIDDSTGIMVTDYRYNPDSLNSFWTTPRLVDVVGNDPKLNIDRSVMNIQFNILNWVRSDQIITYYIFEDFMEINFTYNIPSPTNPSSYFWFIAVDRPSDAPHYLTFDSGLGMNSEIYVTFDEMGYADSIRVTNNQLSDYNPQLFGGEITSPAYSEYVYNIWQTQQNSHRLLYMSKSKATVWGSVGENLAGQFGLTCLPNPFSGKTTIEFKLLKKVPANCRVHSLSGQLIDTFSIGGRSDKTQRIVWEPDERLQKGVYLISLEQENMRGTIKVIYQ